MAARAIVATDEIWVKVLKVQRRVNFPAQYLAAKARCVTFDEIQDAICEGRFDLVAPGPSMDLPGVVAANQL